MTPAEALAEIEKGWRADFDAAEDPTKLHEVRARYMGRDGRLTGVLLGMGTLTATERREIGTRLNVVKAQMDEAFLLRLGALSRVTN